MICQLTYFDFPTTSQRVYRVDFDASTFQPDDLLCLPHREQLSGAVTKRRAEHLAGRIAAREALRFYGVQNYVPGIGLHRAPCWPPGLTGSITHTGNVALATVMQDRQGELCGVGIDTEIIMNAYDAQNIAEGVVNPAERELLHVCGLPFPTALTLSFSAKESLFKALYRHVGRYFNFTAAEVVKITGRQLALRLVSPLGPFREGDTFSVSWNSDGKQLTTLISL
ncbi:enterobactin synthase subunit EntD [Dryocola clanedunensis]|uniref:enterobactin synthase subunit EntD n=1 Tax=Cedecea sulfonylureivorans TaxID=3051154 RepID=UPI0019268B84|nr:enterobactin synthase subunit EntD [Cedecea sulfonylureivorans]